MKSTEEDNTEMKFTFKGKPVELSNPTPNIYTLRSVDRWSELRLEVVTFQDQFAAVEYLGGNQYYIHQLRPTRQEALQLALDSVASKLEDELNKMQFTFKGKPVEVFMAIDEPNRFYFRRRDIGVWSYEVYKIENQFENQFAAVSDLDNGKRFVHQLRPTKQEAIQLALDETK